MFLLWTRTTNPASAPYNSVAQRTRDRLTDDFAHALDHLHEGALGTGHVSVVDLQEAARRSRDQAQQTANAKALSIWYLLAVISFIVIATPVFYEIISFVLGVRCFLPNNHIVYEATRPISDCRFCREVRGPLILRNLTREQFAPFAYSSQPIIIKGAVGHWPAANTLNFEYLKSLYSVMEGALDEDCAFLHFRTNFKSLREVFAMLPERVNLSVSDEAEPWYVGFSNCHTAVLQELRKLYPRPHFLPEDAEMPNTDYIFMGYEQGGWLHADNLPRLMWQAQLRGNKTWILAPTPECDRSCQSFSFFVEPGDAVLVDTRMWYHGTSIPKGQFALTIQSEYG